MTNQLQRNTLEKHHHTYLGLWLGGTLAGLGLAAWSISGYPHYSMLKGLGAMGAFSVSQVAGWEEKRLREQRAILAGGEHRSNTLSIENTLMQAVKSALTVTQTTPQPPLEVEDLALAIAQCPLHILIASASGSGKTSTLLAAISKLPKKSQVYIFDPKNSPEFRQASNYLWVKDRSAIDAMILKLQEIEEILLYRHESGDNEYPIYALCDEFNSILEEAEGTKEKEGSQTQILLGLLKKLITQGRSANVHVWLAAQSALVQDIGFNSSIKDSLEIIAQGRKDKLTSISKAVKSDQIIPDDDDRKRLKDQFEWHKSKHPGSPIPIAYSSIGGARLIQLPDYSGVSYLSVNSANNYVLAGEVTQATNLLQPTIPATIPTSVVEEVVSHSDAIAMVGEEVTPKPAPQNKPKTLPSLEEWKRSLSTTTPVTTVLVATQVKQWAKEKYSMTKIVTEFLGYPSGGDGFIKGKKLYKTLVEMDTNEAE